MNLYTTHMPIKNYLVIVCLFILPALCNAQKRDIQLGFTLSPNIGWMRVTDPQGQPLSSDGSRTGISYGVLADLGFTRNYYFATGFTVTNINTRLLNAMVPNPVSTNYNLQYIEVPLALKLKTNELQYCRFYGQFGLAAGVKIGGKEWINGGGKYSASDAEDFRVALLAGAGAEWQLNSGLRLQTGLDLNHGLTNAISGRYGIRSDYLALHLALFF